MATNKHAQIRYLALNDCFCNLGRRYFMEDLVEACSKAITEYSGGALEVKRRQVFEDINFMESERGYKAEISRHKHGKRVYYRYKDPKFSLMNRLLNASEMDRIKEVLITLSRFKGMPQFEWIDDISSRLHSISGQDEVKIIDFAQNQFLKGLNFITPIFNAAFYKRALAIEYQKFNETKPFTLIVHPYYLKQYNLRWFMFGKDEKSPKLVNFALDRIISIEEQAIAYQENTEIDFGEYFEDIVGVTVLDKPVEKIRLRIAPNLWPYIETKPIHESQKRLKQVKEHIEVELNLIVNYELTSQLLAHGPGIQVLAPASLAEEMKAKISQMLALYEPKD
ncbi:WYL domain-containing protein [Pedobacter aquatilis]|uniref:helix-turn-helix transcriptional regulator n=1 Tax=Pedobacter aquatilis TaxID=351343 RepID=UPI00292EC434|nr:WYL domain-containing protein [Pedobacter aquatilis]